ncbi:type II 3-dehydroquinate dehydratase, partial [Clostridium perfringens]
MRILVINGPNLNMLGIREKGIYGTRNFEDICNYIKEEGQKRNIDITLFQSNIEGEIINAIHKA